MPIFSITVFKFNKNISLFGTLTVIGKGNFIGENLSDVTCYGFILHRDSCVE